MKIDRTCIIYQGYQNDVGRLRNIVYSRKPTSDILYSLIPVLRMQMYAVTRKIQIAFNVHNFWNKTN